jgi:hypothetical protein
MSYRVPARTSHSRSGTEPIRRAGCYFDRGRLRNIIYLIGRSMSISHQACLAVWARGTAMYGHRRRTCGSDAFECGSWISVEPVGLDRLLMAGGHVLDRQLLPLEVFLADDDRVAGAAAGGLFELLGDAGALV